jgi:hypothetical protein
MGDISSVRAAIAPVLQRVQSSKIAGPDMEELVGKLGQLPRSDFDALSRAMLRDTFTGADVTEDAFNLVDSLRAQGKLKDLDGALGSIASRPAPLNVGDFKRAEFTATMQDVLAAVQSGGQPTGQQFGALQEQLAAMPKALFDKVVSKVTGNEYWAPSMREAAFAFLDATQAEGKFPELAATVSKLTD